MLAVEKEHLKKSGFGKVVNYLRGNAKETRENRKKCAQLMQNWSRTVFDKTADYRRLQSMQQGDEERRTFQARTGQRRPAGEVAAAAAAAASSHGGRAGLDALRGGEKKAVDPNARYRAMIPQPLIFDYLHRPEGKAPRPAGPRRSKGGKDDDEGNRAKLKKRMEMVRKPVHKNKRAVTISVEGRGT